MNNLYNSSPVDKRLIFEDPALFDLEVNEIWLGETRRSRPSFVVWLQRGLNIVINAHLVVNGIYGKRTRNAVRRFQRRHRIPPDGVVGPFTERLLREALSNKHRPVQSRLEWQSRNPRRCGCSKCRSMVLRVREMRTDGY